jgi:5-hydroxyisourate hydrolase
MSRVTTHVLDTASGKPAAGVSVRLERSLADESFEEIASGVTDSNGRLGDLMADDALVEGIHRIVFDTGAYHQREGVAGFYPSVTILFRVDDVSQHYHVPLLLSPFGYSTYRGS